MNLPIQVMEPLRLAVYDVGRSVLPRLLAASLFFVGVWVIAALARWVANRAARTEWLERLLVRSGVFAGLVEPSLAGPRRFVANAIYRGIILAGAALALAVLSDSIASRLVAFLLILLPNIFLGVGIFLCAFWLARYWSRSTLIWMANEGIRYPWRWAALVRLSVLAGGIAIASEVTGFATFLIRSTFLILLAGVTFVATQALLPLIRTCLDPAPLRPENERQVPGDDLLPR